MKAGVRIRAIDRAVLSASRRMTPGQRWTAATALIFAILVVALGIPRA